MDLQFLDDNFHSLVYVVFAFSREDHFLPISHLVLSLSFLLSVDCKCWMWLRLCFCVGCYFYCIWIQFFSFFVVILSGFNPSRYLMNMYNGYDSQRLTVQVAMPHETWEDIDDTFDCFSCMWKEKHNT